MCMLTFFPPYGQPDAERLTNGAYQNDDGHGFAIVSGTRLIVRHSMDAEALIAMFVRFRREHPDGPALFHSRWGTGGKRSKFNCHPFRFGGDRRTVVAHNGVLPLSMQPGRKDPRCDTRMAAEELFPRAWGHLSAGDNRASLATAIGVGNKLVILTVNPKYPDNAYLINEERGVWDAGVWYSNLDYLPSKYDRHALLFAEDRCVYCGDLGAGIDPELGYCRTCGTCVDCLQIDTECQCWLPNEEKSAEDDDDEYAGWWAAVLDQRIARIREEAAE